MTTNATPDFQGRSTLSQMSAPVGDSTEGFFFRKNRFNSATDVPYNAKNFDDDLTIANPDAAANTTGSIVDYYDGGTREDGSFIPSAQWFPYARTILSTDGSGRVQEAGGAGEVFRIGGEGSGKSRTTKVYFASASEMELVRLFGDEAPADTSVYKVLVTDANKVTTVQWVSGGRVIATGLESDMGDTLLVPLDHASEPSLVGTNYDTLRGNRGRGRNGSSAFKRYAFTDTTDVTVRYSLHPDTLRAQGNCFDTCATCDYRVRLYVHHLDIADSTQVLEYNLGADPCGSGQVIDTAITLTLPAGSYAIERRLQINTVDTSTVDTLHPYGLTYAEQFRESVGQQMLDSIFANDSLEQVMTYLGNNDLEGLYLYLDLDLDSLHTYGTYTLTTECCEITFPIMNPDCGFDPCRDSTPSFEKHLFDTWKDELDHLGTPYGSDLNTYFKYDRDKTRWPSAGKPAAPFDTLIANMLADTNAAGEFLYDCAELWEIWNGLVIGWEQLKTDPDDETKISPDFDLLNMFLQSAGRYTIDTSRSPYDADRGYLTWAHRYIDSDVLDDDEDCKARLGYNTGWHGDIDSTFHWQSIYECWRGQKREHRNEKLKWYGAGCDLSDTLNGDPSGEAVFVLLSAEEKNDSCMVFTAREIVESAKSHCESRREEWAWEIFFAYQDAAQPVSFEKALCAADAVVDSCKNSCSLTQIGSNPIDTIGTEAEWDAITRVYTWDLEVDVPLLDGSGDPYCDTDSTTLSDFQSVNYYELLIAHLNAKIAEYWRTNGGTVWTGFMDAVREVLPDSLSSRVTDSLVFVPPFSFTGNVPYFKIQGSTPNLHYVADTVYWSDLYPGVDHPMVAHMNELSNNLWHLTLDSSLVYYDECDTTGGQGNDTSVVGRRFENYIYKPIYDSIKDYFNAIEFSFVNGYPEEKPSSDFVSIGSFSYEPWLYPDTLVWGFRPDGYVHFLSPRLVLSAKKGHGCPSSISDNFEIALNLTKNNTTCINLKMAYKDHSQVNCTQISGNQSFYFFDDYLHLLTRNFTDSWGEFFQDSVDNLTFKRYLDRDTTALGADTTVIIHDVSAEPVFGIRFFVAPSRYLGPNFEGTTSCPDICWRFVPPAAIVPDSSTIVGPIPCEETAIRRTVSAINRSAQACVEDEVFKLAELYEAKCGSIDSLDENISVEYDVDYTHFTLYYYDRADNLVRTVPPMGVDVLPTNATRGSPTNHTMVTEYDYDSEGRLVRSKTPDGGESKVWYDQFGRLRFSQDARLAARGEYSYSKFDELGRTIESGVSTEDITGDAFLQDTNINDPDFPQTGTERTYVAYDTASSDVYYIDLSQPVNLRNRVSRTWTDDGSATNFSYDIHGNIEWLAQEIPGFTRPEGPETARFQYLRYIYDLISGNVNEVIYNEDRVDEFRHRYTYDRDNALVAVETSRDSIVWDTDARYEYYQHGPLRRIELGEDYVQGLDFTWTLDGRLKAINYPELAQNKDPGKDGLSTYGHAEVAADSFAIILNYHPLDFRGSGQSYYTFSTVPGFGADELMPVPLYDGNISSIDLHIGKKAGGNQLEERVGTSYRYDQLGRLDSSRLHTFDAGTETWNDFGQEYLTTYDYDANGNIVELVRHGFDHSGATLMDSLVYNYKAATSNQLDWVKEVVAGDAYTEDIENTQSATNYEYDEIGNLIEDYDEGGMSMTWEAGGRVKSVSHALTGGTGHSIDYTYDAGGSRVVKEVTTANGPVVTTTSTFYVRDAVGTVVAIYEKTCEVSSIVDLDNDGIPDSFDNCPGTFNPEQLDTDLDGTGDACDLDNDNDGTPDATDPCPWDPLNACAGNDPDSDGWPNGTDNCPNIYNPAQTDTDGDGIGDVCDGDRDNDGVANELDDCPFDELDECECSINLVELPIYGLGRVGVAHPDININHDLPPTDVFTRELGEKTYELTDHLGNVKATISDRKRSHSPGTGDYFAEFLNYTNAYPYGMPQPGRSWDSTSYRYGFNGMEGDTEVKLAEDHHYTTFFRQYDPRVGRWWSNDPVTHPWQSPYSTMNANPILITDATGAKGDEPETLSNPLDPNPSLEDAESTASGSTEKGLFETIGDAFSEMPISEALTGSPMRPSPGQTGFSEFHLEDNMDALEKVPTMADMTSEERSQYYDNYMKTQMSTTAILGGLVSLGSIPTIAATGTGGAAFGSVFVAFEGGGSVILGTASLIEPEQPAFRRTPIALSTESVVLASTGDPELAEIYGEVTQMLEGIAVLSVGSRTPTGTVRSQVPSRITLTNQMPSDLQLLGNALTLNDLSTNFLKSIGGIITYVSEGSIDSQGGSQQGESRTSTIRVQSSSQGRNEGRQTARFALRVLDAMMHLVE